jgi:RES domain-containing protein
MELWRVSIAENAEDAFSGQGGLRFAARWHKVGTCVVYTSASLALAAMEFFVNWKEQAAPRALASISAHVPDGLRISVLSDQRLPDDWRSSRVREATQQIGSDWARSGESAILSIPSTVIPEERNFLLNPAHRDFKRIRVGKPRPFSFDPRMWK